MKRIETHETNSWHPRAPTILCYTVCSITVDTHEAEPVALKKNAKAFLLGGCERAYLDHASWFGFLPGGFRFAWFISRGSSCCSFAERRSRMRSNTIKRLRNRNAGRNAGLIAPVASARAPVQEIFLLLSG